MNARKTSPILLSVFLLFTSACAKDITLSENDHTLFLLWLSDRDNHVIYAVTTNGECAITDVFPYWKMDDEDGHEEELQWWEEPIYGVDGLAKESDEIWTFHVAQYPDKTVKATVISVESGDAETITCDFVGIALVDNEEAILHEVRVDNDGDDVHSVSFYGDSISNATPVTETVLH